MPKNNEICPQAKHSTLHATPAGAKSAASRNLSNSSPDPAIQAFVGYLQLTFPHLSKIRFKRPGRNRYVIRVKSHGRTFRAAGATPYNAVRNFTAAFTRTALAEA